MDIIWKSNNYNYSIEGFDLTEINDMISSYNELRYSIDVVFYVLCGLFYICMYFICMYMYT